MRGDHGLVDRLGGGFGQPVDLDAALVGLGQHAAEQRDADRTADLARGHQQSGADAGPFLRQVDQGGVHRGHQGQAGAEAGDGQPERGEAVAGVHVGGRAEQTGAREHDQAGDDDRPGAQRLDQRVGSAGADEQTAHHRHQLEAGVHRVLAADGLEVLGDDEEQTGQDQRDQGRGEGVPREAAVAQHADVQHRMRLLALAQDQAGQEGNGADEGREDQGVGPAAARSLDDAEHERGEAGDAQHGADGVEAGGGRVLGLGYQDQAGRDAGGGHGHVDEEDRPPPVVLQQPAADQRAEGHAGRQRRAEGRHRLGAFVGAEQGREDREGEGGDERGPEAHGGAGGDQRPRAVHERAREGTEEQGRQADVQHEAAAEAVAEETGGQHRGGEDHEEGVDDPLLLGGAGVEVARQGG